MSVLDAVIKLKALEQEQAQANVETFIKGVTQAQEMQKTNMLAGLERQKQKVDLMKSGLSVNEAGEFEPASSEILTAIQKANQRPETELDLALKQGRLDKIKDESEERDAKDAVMNSLNEAMNLPDDMPITDKRAWLGEKSPLVAETVGGLLDYNLDPTKFASLRTDERTKYLALARKVDPSFSMMEYPKRQKFLTSISDPSSIAGRNIISLNTIAHHIAQLDEELDANKGVNFKPAQTVLNWARDITGDPSITDERLAHKVVKDEFEKALAGTVTQEALRDFDKIMNPNVGFDAKKKAVKTFVKLVKGRIQPFKDSFKAVMKREEQGEIIFPESQAIFDKYLTAPAEEKETTGQAVEKSAGFVNRTIGNITYKYRKI